MKKQTIALIAACALLQLGSVTFADSMPYEPVFETAPITESLTTAVKEQPTQSTMTAVTKISAASTEQAPANTVENGNLQSALMQLDSAQIEIRNQLIQYKSEYTDIDNQYKLVKEQRAQKAKLIRETERKIKSLDSTKEKIRKNMN